MRIEKETVRTALAMLDTTYASIWDSRKGAAMDIQHARYGGMKDMFEALITNMYKTEIHIDMDREGRHFLREDIFAKGA